MDIQTLRDLGFALSALGIVWFSVRYFTQSLNKKDDSIVELTRSFQKHVDAFTNTINNHIDHATEQAKKETATLASLTKAINALVKKIK